MKVPTGNKSPDKNDERKKHDPFSDYSFCKDSFKKNSAEKKKLAEIFPSAVSEIKHKALASGKALDSRPHTVEKLVRELGGSSSDSKNKEDVVKNRSSDFGHYMNRLVGNLIVEDRNGSKKLSANKQTKDEPLKGNLEKQEQDKETNSEKPPTKQTTLEDGIEERQNEAQFGADFEFNPELEYANIVSLDNGNISIHEPVFSNSVNPSHNTAPQIIQPEANTLPEEKENKKILKIKGIKTAATKDKAEENPRQREPFHSMATPNKIKEAVIIDLQLMKISKSKLPEVEIPDKKVPKLTDSRKDFKQILNSMTRRDIFKANTKN